MASSEVTNEDCMAVMARYPDKYFDLAVVDPPYGIGESSKKFDSRSKLANSGKYKSVNWDDSVPEIHYFNELFRISKHQIIWGANHFIEHINKNSSCWIVWDKDNGETDYADCELAWSNYGTAVRKFKYKWQGMLQEKMGLQKENRIHPTQKPVALYDWIFKNYAKEGYKILDTHLGSGSSRIAADRAGLDFTACELDKEYFDMQEKRWKDYKSQLILEFNNI